MHDPMTVAFQIKRPWPHLRRILGRFYWPTLITVWHVDPERDGSDDSCGWSRPKLTKAQISDLGFYASCEASDPWLLRDRAKRPHDATEAEAKLTYAFLMVGRRLKAKVTYREAAMWAMELIHNPADNIRGSLCHLPGWHTNREDDSKQDRRERALSLYCIVAREILRRRRPWYRHPRWHVWHWKIQAHPVQDFKRWVFSRCGACGRRFPYGYAPLSMNWGGDGPLWFKGEANVYHHECAPSGKPAIEVERV